MKFKSNQELKSNQKKLSADMDDKLLRRLEQKAISKVRGFTNKLAAVDREIGLIPDPKAVIPWRLRERKQMLLRRLLFWEKRQDDIQELLAQRILLEYETESNK